MFILLLGAPGSGKGTIGELIEKDLKLPRMQMGDFVRAEIKNKTKFGLLAEKMTKKGLLVPDDKIVNLFFKVLKKPLFKKGALLDGFPRTLPQAKTLQEQGVNLSHVIYLYAPDKVLIRRMTSRRICPKGHVFNLLTMKPKHQGICDYCKQKLIQRPDDNVATARNRIKVYNSSTKPLLDFFKKQKFEVMRINSDGKPVAIAKKIVGSLKIKR